MKICTFGKCQIGCLLALNILKMDKWMLLINILGKMHISFTKKILSFITITTHHISTTGSALCFGTWSALGKLFPSLRQSQTPDTTPDTV